MVKERDYALMNRLPGNNSQNVKKVFAVKDNRIFFRISQIIWQRANSTCMSVGESVVNRIRTVSGTSN